MPIGMLDRRLWFSEQGFLDFVEVPYPVYGQALAMELVHPLGKGHGWVLPASLDNRPENYIRATTFRFKERLWLLDPHFAHVAQGTVEKAIHENDVQKVVYFGRGRINQRLLDHAHDGTRFDAEQRAELIFFAKYLFDLQSQTHTRGDWTLLFDHYIRSMSGGPEFNVMMEYLTTGRYDWMISNHEAMIPK